MILNYMGYDDVLISELPFGAFLLDQALAIRAANRAAEELLGTGKLISFRFTSFLDSLEMADFFASRARAVDAGQMIEIECPVRVLPGEATVFCLVSVKRLAEDLDFCRYIVVVQDVTRRKAVEKVMESSFDNFIQTTLNLDAALKKIKEQRATLERFHKKITRELEIARTVQKSIIPRSFPGNEVYEVWGMSSSSEQIGGDYIDAIELGPGRQALVVADVSGHGMGSALITTMLRASMRELLFRHQRFDFVFNDLNRIIFDTFSHTGFYLTAIGLIADSRKRYLEVCVAGHESALHILSAGWVDRGGSSGGRIIGAVEDVEYKTEQFEMQRGEIIALYTDGISECRSSSGGFFGKERLISSMHNRYHMSLKEIVQGLEEDLTAFADGEEAHDDQTVLLLRWKG